MLVKAIVEDVCAGLVVIGSRCLCSRESQVVFPVGLQMLYRKEVRQSQRW